MKKIFVITFMFMLFSSIAFASIKPYQNQYVNGNTNYLLVSDTVNNQYLALENNVMKVKVYTDKKHNRHEIYKGYIIPCKRIGSMVIMDNYSHRIPVKMEMVHYKVDDNVYVTYYVKNKVITHSAGKYNIEYQLYWAMAENAM